MKLAIESANLKLNEINFINAHSTSTPAGDLAEIKAVKRLFENSCNQDDVYITSLKGTMGKKYIHPLLSSSLFFNHLSDNKLLGHLLGAAGAVESIFTMLTCKEKIIPPSINIDKLDPALKLEESPFLKIVANHNIILDKAKLIALKNSFGFGGTNACLIISSYNN
jgi:3-oxoacyl-[acyl-carrier-protein] synthase II